jgi:hypothetical protein
MITQSAAPRVSGPSQVRRESSELVVANQIVVSWPLSQQSPHQVRTATIVRQPRKFYVESANSNSLIVQTAWLLALVVASGIINPVSSPESTNGSHKAHPSDGCANNVSTYGRVLKLSWIFSEPHHRRDRWGCQAQKSGRDCSMKIAKPLLITLSSKSGTPPWRAGAINTRLLRVTNYACSVAWLLANARVAKLWQAWESR